MNAAPVTIRLMQASDYDAVVDIDRRILGAARSEYYSMKFDKLFQSKDYLPTSLVAEDEQQAVVGFIMGELYMGEYGIFQEEARLDTIGVDPRFQSQGVGEMLISEFMNHLRHMGVTKVNTLVDWNDSKLIKFFSENRFTPSRTINLERSL